MCHPWVASLLVGVVQVRSTYATGIEATNTSYISSIAPSHPNTTACPDAKFTNAPNASFSFISGPFMDGPSYIWTRAYEPNTIGTVIVTVDQSSRPLGSTTVYQSNATICAPSTTSEVVFESDRTKTGCTIATMDVPESTNCTGTKFVDLPGEVQLTYPTNHFGAKAELTWAAILPIAMTGEYLQLAARPTAYSALDTYRIHNPGEEKTCCFMSFAIQPMPTRLQNGSRHATDRSEGSTRLALRDKFNRHWQLLWQRKLSPAFARPSFIGIRPTDVDSSLHRLLALYVCSHSRETYGRSN